MKFVHPKERAVGKLVRLEYQHGAHYPVFAVETRGGERVESRARGELPIEEMLAPARAAAFLRRPLPIGNVWITYRADAPTRFHAVYL